MPPSTPPVPECLTCKPHPEVLRARHLSPSTPPGDLPRMRPSPPRVPSGRAERPLPGTLRVRRAPETPHREITPEHSASTPRVPGSDSFFFSRIKIHRKAMQL